MNFFRWKKGMVNALTTVIVYLVLVIIFLAVVTQINNLYKLYLK